MRLAIFSDVHGNLPALERFIRNTRASTDGYICLGDVVNYGPWNDECLEMILDLPGIILLEGNHERLFRGEESLEDELPLVQEFYRCSFPSFTRTDLIQGLPRSVEVGDYLAIHTLPGQRVYPDSRVQTDRNVFVGHTHHQCRIEAAGNVVINVGSVGQNRARGGRMCYATYDVDAGEVTLHEEPYAHERFMAELRTRGYSPACIEYYEKKMAAGWEAS